MRTALLAILLILAGDATAPSTPKIQTTSARAQIEMIMKLLGEPQNTSEWKKFDTLHEAAVFASQRMVECSIYYECSGQIFKHDGKFVVGPVHSDYATNHVSMQDDGPLGWYMAADVHSHPCSPHSITRVFSPQDMINAIVSRVPVSYMLDMCTGAVHEFIPNVTKIDEEQVDAGLWMSQGKIIGHIPPSKMPLAKEGV